MKGNGRGIPWSHGVAVAVCLALSAPAALADQGEGDHVNFLDLNGKADWEIYRSTGVVDGAESSFNAFRRKYSIDLAGSLVDYRFNRFFVGLDLYRDDRSSGAGDAETKSLGYRAQTTFFPNRPFPLQLFARRSSIDPSGSSAADNSRETAAWGADWNLLIRRHHQARFRYDQTARALTAPVLVETRLEHASVEWTQRYARRDNKFSYSRNNERELVRNTAFSRHELTLTDRTRFGKGGMLLFNGSYLESDARFAGGETDALTQQRWSTMLNFPRTHRLAWSVNLDHNDNSGKFVDSNHQQIRAAARVLLGKRWEALSATSRGSLESVTSTQTIREDTSGASFGLRFNDQWGRTSFTANGTAGVHHSVFETGEERALTNLALELMARLSLERVALHGSVSGRQDENDTSGVGFSYDETQVRWGIEGALGNGRQADTTLYARRRTHDTFQFGIQESTEVGLTSSLQLRRGSLTFQASTQDGVSDFIPDPSSTGPFLPGTDLVHNQERIALGVRLRLFQRMQVRARVQYERRDFTTIGEDTVLSYQPEVEWSPGLWRLVLGVSHYARDNGTDYAQDTVLFRVSRRFF